MKRCREWKNGEPPITERVGAPTVTPESRYSQADLCGWLPAVLVTWDKGSRFWIHPADAAVQTFDAAKRASVKLLERMRLQGEWPFSESGVMPPENQP